jgi:hypothetical protein
MSREEMKLAAAMAEFEALRAEILSIRQVKRNLLSIALAAYAAIFSFALGANGDSALLLVVPPLGLALSLFELSETIQIAQLGTYIREQVWPVVTDVTGYEHSWEIRHDGHGPVGKAGLAMLLDGGLPGTLFGASFVAILMMNDLSGPAMAFAWMCAVLTLASPVIYGIIFLRDYRKKRRARKAAAGAKVTPR